MSPWIRELGEHNNRGATCTLKVSQFKNEFLASKILQKSTEKIGRITVLISNKWLKQKNDDNVSYWLELALKIS